MTYSEFIDKITKDLQTDFGTILPERYRKAEIGSREVQKLQGRSYLGLTFRPEGAATEASLDLKPLYESFKNGRPYSALLKELEQELLKLANRMPSPDPELFSNYDKLKHHLMIQMIPRKGNEKMLEDLPHRDLEDLCAVYRFDLCCLGCPDSSILITRSMLEDYGITPEQLHSDALQYAPLLHPASFRKLHDIIKENGGADIPEDADAPAIFVATVENGFSGAGVLLYPGFLDYAAGRLKGRFFILPSSIHELLFIEDNDDIRPEFLKEMVRSINEAHVAPEDRLSNCVYHYTSGSGLPEAV
ncbi:MAG: hypothetical protein IJT43_11930 [Stomatobaculum sp.]|nr:hypothetical protein [Stomatobaculum sp.]